MRAHPSSRLAQWNSVPRIANPKNTMSHPGPGSGTRINPTTTTSAPTAVSTTRYSVSSHRRRLMTARTRDEL